MPVAHVLRRSTVEKSSRVRQVLGMFDVPDKKEIVHEWNVSLPIEEKPWHLGLIVGPSGAGKTTIATELFPKAYLHKGFEWPAKASLLDAFPEQASIKDITTALNAVGFSSPPHWLKSWHHLSNGHDRARPWMRVELLGISEGQWQGEPCYVLRLGRVLEIGNWVDSPSTACQPTLPI